MGKRDRVVYAVDMLSDAAALVREASDFVARAGFLSRAVIVVGRAVGIESDIIRLRVLLEGLSEED